MKAKIRQQIQRPPMPDNGLYSFANEHDACGVGLVATLTNEPTHEIVLQGLTVLKRLMHRGAAGGDPETGDGAGILTAIPDEFFRSEYPQLPAAGAYAVGMLFGGTNAEQALEKIVGDEGADMLFWRNVPCQPNAIGKMARETMPQIRQIFIGGSAFESQDAFERKLFVIRRRAEKEIADCYFCSLSSRSIVYKGLLLATQIEEFFPDLANEKFRSAVALVHQRYSTNTFPAWHLAHPFRYLAHNGEINTLRGNLNHLRTREPHLASPLFGDDMPKLFPLIDPTQSDSACLDNMFELINASGRSLSHSMLMLMPQAWGKNYHMGRDVRGFFEYHSALMEPWDGPAAVAFSDGVNAGAILDRNGLRPARYTLCHNGLFVLASETGVLDIKPEDVERKGRLRPGEMLYLDIENHRLLLDNEIKNRNARNKPYRRWVEENKISVHGLFQEITPAQVPNDLLVRHKRFGYSREDLELIIKDMAAKGHEPVGSMGNDAALAVLSQKPQLLFHYFKQLFAQVTNPPIDPIREELVMSLTTYIGNKANILEETPQHAHLIKLNRPIITDDEIARLQDLAHEGFNSKTLTIEFPANGDGRALDSALKTLASDAVNAVSKGCKILILSDRYLSDNTTPIPALLALTAVNRALTDAGLRPDCGVIVQSGEVREIMHFALLLGYGATAINPYLALQTVSEMATNGKIKIDSVKAASNYIKAVDKGLLKVMSKMGISTLRSYRSGQIFEAVGLCKEFIDTYFPGTASRIGGIGLEEIAAEANARANQARNCSPLLEDGGQYRYRADGEQHLWTPESLANFRQAVMENDRAKFNVYSSLIDNQAKHLCTLRGLFEFAETTSIDLAEVESVESIMRRFVTGAMSLGSLSPEAHEAIAVAMNSIGGMSNCGEGGEDCERLIPGHNGENRSSAIRQIASGRFGVTIEYLRHARDLQIKMAQGAKPGEGGQLPGHKVDKFIARIRHSMPNVTLISPPPHHDIYSIEDLAQLIFDLRNSNPKARVSVKLVSEVGVGTVAAGVAKAHSDVVLISGHDGGTGASPLTSIKHAGLPWELGLAEAQQTLVLNDLRSRIKVQLDGQLKTGRDVLIGALLGAEEFGFATTILVCLGCLMMRKCHENSCPVGVATQDANLRKCFRGKPEYIVNFLRFLAEDVREGLAKLGLRSIDEAVGRSDLLKTNEAINFYKTQNLDFSAMLKMATGDAVRFDPNFEKEPLVNFDRRELIPQLKQNIIDGTTGSVTTTVQNVDRTVGTELSGDIAELYGEAGLPEDTININLTGCAGQSFGAFLAKGVTMTLEGEANDFVGKGLSGGKIILKPSSKATFEASANVIAGNVTGYGATSGKVFINGQAGERFAIRNSGATMVTEGVGDHGCEYMTGGRIVVLGTTGVNFAAGMTGGLAYIYDESGDFDLRCNVESVDLESIETESADEKELMGLIAEHVAATGSVQGSSILENWTECRPKFVKVYPVEYRQALGLMAQNDAEAVNRQKQVQ